MRYKSKDSLQHANPLISDNPPTTTNESTTCHVHTLKRKGKVVQEQNKTRLLPWILTAALGTTDIHVKI